MKVPSFCILALLILGCTPADGQGGLTLEKKLPVSFGQLSNVVELRDGRVVFADTRAKEQTQVLEQVGVKLRAMMPFLDPVTVRPDGVTA